MFTHSGNGDGPYSWYNHNGFLHANTMRELGRAYGWRMVRNGHLRRFYQGDTLLAAFSYDTCIFAVITLADGERRLVLNLTKYSHTTGRHQDEMLREATGIWGRYSLSIAHSNSLSLDVRRAIDFFDVRSHVSMADLQWLAVERLRYGNKSLQLAELNAVAAH